MSGPVDQGQTWRYRHLVRDSAGVLVNAGTVTVTITLPDATTASPAVVNSATGTYDIAYLTTQAGLHQISGQASGGILGSEIDVWQDVFSVETPGRAYIGVDEASASLRGSVTITGSADREQLRWLCLAACGIVERDLGIKIARRSVAETYDGGTSLIVLRSLPVISITSVTENGITLASTGYVTDPITGALYRGTQIAPRAFARGRQNIVVTYLAGYAEVPRSIREVTLKLIQRMWQTSQQMPHSALDEISAGASVFDVIGSSDELDVSAYRSHRVGGVA